jgi:Clr5 domain
MPRPSINLEPYKAEITQLFQDGMSSRDIAAHIQGRHGISVKERTIKSRLQGWKVRKRNQPSNTDSALCERITALFFECGLEDREMLHVLQDENFDITLRSLGRLRRGLNLHRRESPTQAEQKTPEYKEIIKEELRKGIIIGYGREMLHRHFRSLGVIIAR